MPQKTVLVRVTEDGVDAIAAFLLPHHCNCGAGSEGAARRSHEWISKAFVAIDFSPDSNEALREAHERAESTGAQLAVCHVVSNER